MPMPTALRPLFLSALMLGTWLCACPAFAQRVEGSVARASGPFEVEVPVNSQGAADRKAALARALAQVLGAMSGDRSAASRPGVGQEMRRADEYVRSYDYRQDEGISTVTGAPTFQTTLIVRFDEDKVQRMAAELGLPVWPSPRPKPVLWLAIDDGSGPRLVGLSQSDAARPVLDRAVQRGYRLGLPRGNAAEQAAVGAIWRGDSAAIARISSRYQPPMQLIGKMYRSKKEGAGWTTDWIFVDDGRVLARWSEDDSSPRRAMAAGADGAADALVKRYAKRNPDAGPAGTYRVAFEQIDSADEYIRLAGQLERVSVVKQVMPVQASAQRLELDLTLSTGLAGFRRLIDRSVLVEGDVPPADIPLILPDAPDAPDAPVTTTRPPDAVFVVH